MHKTKWRLVFGAMSVLLASVMPAKSNGWPNRPIVLVVPFGPGGAPDIIARFLAQELSEKLNQRVLVENRPGNSGNIGAMAVARSAPDGHMLLLGTPNPIALNKMIQGATQGFDPDKDLRPISILG